MKKKQYLIALAMSAVASLTMQCKKEDDPQPEPDEEETITTVMLSLVATDTTNNSTAKWSDVDGEGGNNPVIDTLYLSATTEFTAGISFLDESKNPAEDITEEIKEEANDHQVFYAPSSDLVTVTYDDQDTNTPPLPIGLRTKMMTKGAGTGMIKVTLKHQPDIKDGNIATGETDIEVDIPFRIR